MADSPIEIVWEEPPPPSRPARRGFQWEVTFGRLMAHPGRWARIREYDTKGGAASDKYRLTAKNTKAIQHLVPKGRWEFEARQIDSDKSALWVRYLGQ